MTAASDGRWQTLDGETSSPSTPHHAVKRRNRARNLLQRTACEPSSTSLPVSSAQGLSVSASTRCGSFRQDRRPCGVLLDEHSRGRRS